MANNDITQAGKGDSPRPVNGRRYRNNYDAIFRKKYPAWICDDCGKQHGNRPDGNPQGATYHLGICGVCHRKTEVTEPRDFGHLKGNWS